MTTTEMPKVKLPLSVKILRAIGALRVCVTGYDQLKNEFIYTTQFRRWHPISLLIAVLTALTVGLFDYFVASYSKMEWRSRNG